MTTFQKILTALLIIIAVLLGGIFYNKYAPAAKGTATTTPEKTATTTTPSSGTAQSSEPAMTTEKYTHTDKYKSYVYDASYPKDAEKKYPELYATIQSVKAGFLDDYNSVSDADAQQMDLPERSYNFTVTTDIKKSSKTTTFLLNIYTFEGGAHGGTTVYSFTYDATGKLVPLSRVFTKPYLTTVASLSRTYFHAKLPDIPVYMVDAGTEASTTNFSTWYLTDSTVTFVFQQYQVGPYVIGIQEYPIPKSQLSTLLSSEFK